MPWYNPINIYGDCKDLFFCSKHWQEATRKCGLAAGVREKAFLGHIGMIGLRFQRVGRENPGGEDIPIRLLLLKFFAITKLFFRNQVLIMDYPLYLVDFVTSCHIPLKLLELSRFSAFSPVCTRGIG